MEKEFIDFINDHHVLSFCVCNEGIPYCASCFYAFMDNKFIISSDAKTKHITYALKSKQIAGTISLETKNISLIQGLQFNGIIKKGSKESKFIYLKKFPYAVVFLKDIWEIKITYAKLTNNTIGFGRKKEFIL